MGAVAETEVGSARDFVLRFLSQQGTGAHVRPRDLVMAADREGLSEPAVVAAVWDLVGTESVAFTSDWQIQLTPAYI